MLISRLIYALLEKEFLVFRDYLKENLRKRIIREFKSLVDYLILFILKKDGKLRLYVNYRKLNNITIKIDIYLLILENYRIDSRIR